GEGELAGRRALGQVVASDVLKVPHHGSRTSSSTELLDAVHPSVAVISLGWKNRFHFPNPAVLERYRARGVRVLRTDLDGAITVRAAPDGRLSIACARGCPP
ncbi:MAG TPA: competence protein ComEC, partial [Polyangia bacterium]|nr:competence protein ComEC [Polyangia bacterium]